MRKQISYEQKFQWRKSYKLRRYLADMSFTDLETRLDDILINLLDFSNEGRPFFNQTLEMKGLVERYIHVDEEISQRGIYKFSSLINNPAKYLNNKYPNIENAVKVWSDRKPKKPYLIKFGNKEHLVQMKNNGKIRINPASYYKDSSLNKAIHDDEFVQITMLPGGTKLERQTHNGNYEEINGVRNISITNKYSTDFYVYCMSIIYQHHLFDDFNANACLLIHNTRMFLKKILKSLKVNYPDWLVKSGNVKYYDPFFPDNPVDIPFNKHFRYWYQGEYRITFRPKTFIEKLEHTDLVIGSLEDCSELILL